jgi:hypothetical protein
MTLEHLLRAQIRMAQELPYWPFDSTMPSLDAVYLEPRLHPFDRRPDKVPPRLGLHEALFDTDHHLLIIGEPGSGKTTLGIRSVASLGGSILDGSAEQSEIPLYVPAHLLKRGGDFTTLLSAAVTTFLASFLSQPLSSELLSSTPPGGSRWLVFIDGLDELVNPTERQRFIAALTHHTEKQIYRFVVLSRPLSPTSLRALQATMVDWYEIAPLEALEIGALAKLWFQSRANSDPENSERAS